MLLIFTFAKFFYDHVYVWEWRNKNLNLKNIEDHFSKTDFSWSILLRLVEKTLVIVSYLIGKFFLIRSTFLVSFGLTFLDSFKKSSFGQIKKRTLPKLYFTWFILILEVTPILAFKPQTKG